MSLATVAWSGDRLDVALLDTSGGDLEKLATFAFNAPLDERYDVTLRRDSVEGWWLRAPFPDGRQFGHITRQGADTIVPPDVGNISLGKCKIHAGDILTVISEAAFNVRQKGSTGWFGIPLPARTRIDDVSFDEGGGCWLVGSAAGPNRRATRSAAIAYYLPPGADRYQPRPPKVGVLGAMRTVPAGGLERLRTIDAEGDQKIATSDTPELLRNPSSFVFSWRNGGPWSAARIGTLVRGVVRTETDVLVVTIAGAIKAIAEDGGLKEVSDGTRLRGLLIAGDDRGNARLTVRALSARNGLLAVVAGVSAVVEGRLSWLATAICVSRDGGRDWSLLKLTRPASGESELLAVAL